MCYSVAIATGWNSITELYIQVLCSFTRYYCFESNYRRFSGDKHWFFMVVLTWQTACGGSTMKWRGLTRSLGSCQVHWCRTFQISNLLRQSRPGFECFHHAQLPCLDFYASRLWVHQPRPCLMGALVDYLKMWHGWPFWLLDDLNYCGGMSKVKVTLPSCLSHPFKKNPEFKACYFSANTNLDCRMNRCHLGGQMWLKSHVLLIADTETTFRGILLKVLWGFCCMFITCI